VPHDWQRGFAVLAATFHFQPSELERMTADELEMWIEQANWVNGRG
jgi:hypothetical protein